MTPAGPGTAAVRRVTAQLLGWVAVLTAPAWVHGATTQAGAMATWWNVAVLGAVGVSVAMMTVAALAGRVARAHVVAVAASVAVGVLSWPWGAVDHAATASRMPWLWLILPMTLAAVATLDSVTTSMAYGVGVVVPFAWYRTTDVGGAGRPLIVLLEAGLLLVVAVGLTVLVRASWDAARVVDEDARRAAEAGAEAAGMVAAVEARREVDAVVHDQVLSALTIATRSPSSADVPLLARDALAALDAVAASADEPRTTTLADLHDRLVSAAQVVSSQVQVACSPPTDATPVAEPVARAVVEATAEAVRNAVRHGRPGGEAPQVTVCLRAEPVPGGVVPLVVVEDDGDGFDPAAVAPERLGLDLSVRGRMRAVGGSADVESAPGQGTRVTIRGPAATRAPGLDPRGPRP